jgi:hypothetical protein
MSPNPPVGSVAEHGRDPLVEVEHAGVVEEYLAAVGDDSLDHLVHRFSSLRQIVGRLVLRTHGGLAVAG